MACYEAPQPADALTEPIEMTITQEIKEDKKEEKHCPAPVSQQMPVGATKPKLFMAGERDVRAHSPCSSFPWELICSSVLVLS